MKLKDFPLPLVLLASLVSSYELKIVRTPSLSMIHLLTGVQSQKSADRQQCNGMYSRSTWGGDTDPHITTKFSKSTAEGDDDTTVSLVIFEWRDEDLVGIWPSEDAPSVCRTKHHHLLRSWSIENIRLRRARSVCQPVQARAAGRIHTGSGD